VTGPEADAKRSGLVIVDKPAGLTSHDVVARIRRLAGTRKVGHAGTLDPMATGVLVVGVEKATRLLGYLTLTEKEYAATIRLGASTSTDDAEGEVTGSVALDAAAAVLAERQLGPAVAGLTGEIQQAPPAVSAIKVDGQRAYRLTRAGAAPELKARPVTVHEFTVTAVRHEGDFVDLDATVRCSGLDRAHTLEQLAERLDLLPLAQAAAAAFPSRWLTADEARRLAHGGRLAPDADARTPEAGARTPEAGARTPADALPPEAGARTPADARTPTAAYAPDGTLVALLTQESGQARPLVVFA
jgi:tRNA pseudouridine55 synthase